MTALNSTQATEVTFLTGVTAKGAVAQESYWTWNGGSPATYGSSSLAAKWGSGAVGTGATISYGFDAASNWTATEKEAFVSSMKLWSAVANINFVESSGSAAKFTITRGDDGSAWGGQGHGRASSIGAAQEGTAYSGSLSIDTSIGSFGSLGSSFSNYGGYPWMTMLHEIGHVLGLGHGGAYDAGLGVDESLYTSYDNYAWTIMSYNRETTDSLASHSWGSSISDDGLRYRNVPTTWMPLDIVAIQRIYGVAVNTPLSGGQTYGFHSTIVGEIADYFDFTVNTKPIVTLWSKGVGNTLDLSGFSSAATVDLHDGAFSSAAGLTNNIAIAIGTKIDGLYTGTGADTIVGNDDGNYIQGGGSSDKISGGNGNDHLYGGGTAAINGDGADTISGGDGSDYIQGNAGNDSLDGSAGSDRIVGGQGDDRITGGDGNDSINGNLGNDSADGGAGNDSMRGGQGNDSLSGSAGDDILFGDAGADTLSGGAGADQLTGGGDADIFVFETGSAIPATAADGRPMIDEITDFTDGVDHIRLGIGIPTDLLHDAAAATLANAMARAQVLLDSRAGHGDVAALTVGGDSYLFYEPDGATQLEVIRLSGFGNAAAITVADFI